MSAQRNSAISTTSANSPPPPVVCHCGGVAVVRTVVKEGPNVGRRFYGCPGYPHTKCKFLTWIDDSSKGKNELEELRWKLFEKDVTIAEMEYREQMKDEKIEKLQRKREKLDEENQELKTRLVHSRAELIRATTNERSYCIAILVSWLLFAIVAYLKY